MSLIIDINDQEINTIIKKTVDILATGGLVCFPTETVYALAADSTNDIAVEKIFSAKGRSLNQPLSLLFSTIKQVEEVALVTDQARQLLAKFSPGPLTIVLKLKQPSPVSSLVTGGLDNIGIRIPDSDLALQIISRLGKPVVGTSANITGQASAVIANQAINALGDKVDLIIDGGKSLISVPSTVVDLSHDEPKILRLGTISAKDIYVTLNK